MLTRIDLKFTTLLSARLKDPAHKGTSKEFLPKSYDSQRVVLNSGAAGVWGLGTAIRWPENSENPIEDATQEEEWVAVCTLSGARADHLDLVKEKVGSSECDLVFKVPNAIVGPHNPLIVVTPIKAALPNGVGRGKTLLDAHDRAPSIGGVSLSSHIDMDAPNWLYSSFDSNGPVMWEEPGARGDNDLEKTLTLERELFSRDKAGGNTFRIPLSQAILEGLVAETFSGLRISLKWSPRDLWALHSASVSAENAREWSAAPLLFANASNIHQQITPYLEIRAPERTLDSSGNFVIDEPNLVGVNLTRNLQEAVPSWVEDTIDPSGPDDLTGVQATLEGRLSLLHRTFTFILNEPDDGAAPFSKLVGKDRLEATVQIVPEFLDMRLVDLLGLTTHPDPDSVPSDDDDIDSGGMGWGYDGYGSDFVEDEECLPENPTENIPESYLESILDDEMPIPYRDPRFWEFWNSPLNADFRADRPFVEVLRNVTLKEALLEGSGNLNQDRWLLQLFVSWEQRVDESSEGETLKVLATTKLRPRGYDPFNPAIANLQTDVYPRVTTVRMKRHWSRDELPQRVNVFVDDRPPQMMTNQTLRRIGTERTSALIEDLAWGIVPGASYGTNTWWVKPSEATLMSHDGRLHHFPFDPHLLPRGTWKFEFVRLGTGAIVRQINSVSFTVSD